MARSWLWVTVLVAPLLLGAAPTPAYQGSPLVFAWPPHYTERVGPAESASLIQDSLGYQVNFVNIVGETKGTVQLLSGDRVRVDFAGPGNHSGLLLSPYTERWDSASGVCDQVDDEEPGCDPPTDYLAGLDVDWKDRPNGLIITPDLRSSDVIWVVGHGRIVADEPAATATVLRQMLGLPPLNGTTQESGGFGYLLLYSSSQKPGIVAPPMGAAEMNGTAQAPIWLDCAECTSYAWQRTEPRASEERIVWYVDPDGYVAWVDAGPVIDFERTPLIAADEKDRRIAQFADAKRVELHNAGTPLEIHHESHRLNWRLQFAYGNEENNRWKGGHVIAWLDAHDGSFWTEYDSGPLSESAGPSWWEALDLKAIGIAALILGLLVVFVRSWRE